MDNLNVGGPYKITVKAMGYEEYSNSQIELSLGENDLHAVSLEKKVNTLQEVSVTGKKSARAGGTQITQAVINGLPNINRGIQDVTKLNLPCLLVVVSKLELVGK